MITDSLYRDAERYNAENLLVAVAYAEDFARRRAVSLEYVTVAL
jgi:hypothetical protein